MANFSLLFIIMRKEEMRVLSARNNQLSSTLPITLDSDLTPVQKRKSVDYGIRGRSIYKPERSIDLQPENDAYSELKSLYEKALTENYSLKSEANYESSISYVRLDKETSVKMSLSNEIEELQHILAETFESIKVLKEYQQELIANKIQAKKELDEQRGLHSFAKDNMISLLQGKLNNTVDMLKTVYRDKKNLEGLLDKEEKTKHSLQGQSAALEEKLKVLDGRNKDLMTVGQLNTQISNILGKQDAVNKKIEKYEAYIQSKKKKS